MKVSKQWLKEYVQIEVPDSELEDRLNKTGTEVDEVSAGIHPLVVVAEIKKIEKHPNADRLQIAIVTDGEKEYEVVCGALNIEVGQKVPFAKIGARLPEFSIEEAKIRGTVSHGMLCAPDELGLGEDHSGIMILSAQYELGKPLAEYLDQDTVFELEVTPNRGDCLSHFGIAREISAFLHGQTLKKEPISLQMSEEKADKVISVNISNSEDCPAYMARIIKNVKIGPSPLWLQEKLLKVGLRPINNIVDVTNYIMMDLGQPLHAFDLKKVQGSSIVVRRAKNDEKLLCLDGKERVLSSNILVISDSLGPIAIAGIIGGENSGVTPATTDIVLEAAQFNRKVIRKGKKILNVNTDASYRFERGIDSQGVEYALNKAAKIMAEICGGKILSGIVKESVVQPKIKIDIPTEKIREFLGITINNNEMFHILKSLGIEIKDGRAIVPSWRHDLSIWQDLAEEVGRIFGYNKVPLIPLPKTPKPPKSAFYIKETVKDNLVNLGFSEVKNYSFLSADEATIAGIKTSGLLEVANPLQPENRYLRNSLIPGLLKNISKNSSFDPVLIFEIGQVFSKEGESSMLGLAAAGKNADKLLEKAKSELLEKYNIKKHDLVVSKLTNDQAQKYKIRKPQTLFFEVNIDGIKKIKDNLDLKISNATIHYRKVSKYPSITRDLSFIVDAAVDASSLIDTLYTISENINRVELFDEFKSDKLGKDKKSLAFHLYLQDLDKTMIDEEADEIIKKAIEIIKKKFNATLRDK